LLDFLLAYKGEKEKKEGTAAVDLVKFISSVEFKVFLDDDIFCFNDVDRQVYCGLSCSLVRLASMELLFLSSSDSLKFHGT
jgi:hypothetical protein